MDPDAELLRRYVEDHSEVAFTELVQRHLNLVYFSALRQLGGDPHRAQDVAQAVFTDLARKAAALRRHPMLTAWLHTSVRFAAAKARRTDGFRQQREREAMKMTALVSEPRPDWEQVRPLIDDAIHELAERDREAVLLRYFENRSFAEIGATLRLSEDAARMRVDRALEKLRVVLSRRSVKSTTAALAIVFADSVGAETAPAGLAPTIAAAALAHTAATGGAVAGAGVFMSKVTLVAVGALSVVALGLVFLQSQRAARAETELQALTTEHDRLAAGLRAEQRRAAISTQELAASRRELDDLKTKLASVAPAPAAVPVSPARLVLDQQKAILTNLRKITAAADQFVVQYGRLPTSLDEIVGPTKFIKELKPVDGEDYAGIPLIPWMPQLVTTAGGVTVMNDMNGPNTTRPEPSPAVLRAAELARRIEPSYRKALQDYFSAQGRKVVPSDDKLIPYFTTPQEGADFVEFIEARKAANQR